MSRSLAISAIGEVSDLGSQLQEKKLEEPPNRKINITDTQIKARSSQVMVLLSLLLRHDNIKLYIASLLFFEGQCTLWVATCDIKTVSSEVNIMLRLIEKKEMEIFNRQRWRWEFQWTICFKQLPLTESGIDFNYYASI